MSRALRCGVAEARQQLAKRRLRAIPHPPFLRPLHYPSSREAVWSGRYIEEIKLFPLGAHFFQLRAQ